MCRCGIVSVVAVVAVSVALVSGQGAPAQKLDPAKFLTQPLITKIYTADPSAHVFNGKIYIYPSHDIDAGVPADDLGSHFAMRDYHVLSMDAIGGPVTDHAVALDIKDVPWAGRQMWAPDAAEKGGKYYLYFPVKDKQDVFRIGAAVSDKPAGPFKAQPQPIKGTYSIDPAVFKDTDGKFYMYFGGIWGGQLQRWSTGTYVAKDVYPAKGQAALSAKVRDVSELLVELGPVAPRHPLQVTVAYHDACHLAHAQQVRAQPRELLRAIPGLELLEPAEWELCCGSAGIYNLLQPEAAAQLGARKAENLRATGAEAIAAANPGCALQIGRHLDLPIYHPMTLLDLSLRGATP